MPKLGFLSRLIRRFREDVVVSRDGKPLARITRLEAGPRVKFGLLKGRIEVPEEFDKPLAQDVAALFEDR